MFGKFDKVFFLRRHKTAPKIIVTAVYGAFAARTVFKIVNVARLNYVAAMFALYDIPLDYAFHRQGMFWDNLALPILGYGVVFLHKQFNIWR